MRASNKVMRPSKAFLITWHLNGNPKNDINLAAGEYSSRIRSPCKAQDAVFKELKVSWCGRCEMSEGQRTNRVGHRSLAVHDLVGHGKEYGFSSEES